MNDLEKIPDYVLQRNAISQGMYNLSTNARRLVAMAMTQLKLDTEEYRAEFSVAEFFTTLGIDHGTRQNELILSAARECLDSHIEVKYPNGEWKGWTWFSEISLEFEVGDTGQFRDIYRLSKNDMNLSGWNKIIMEFNPKLGKAIKEFTGYAPINLLEFGKLQSRYAQRFYELAMSWKGNEGEKGNAPGTWKIPYLSLADIRQRFGISKSKYRAAKEFRRNIIDKPIGEINDPEKNMSIRIEPEYNYHRRSLAGVNLICRWVRRDEPKNVTPATETDWENETLISKYPKEFEKRYANNLEGVQKDNSNKLIQDRPDLQELMAREKTFEEMREAHPQTKRRGKKK